jgi:hypothetical protein
VSSSATASGVVTTRRLNGSRARGKCVIRGRWDRFVGISILSVFDVRLNQLLFIRVLFFLFGKHVFFVFFLQFHGVGRRG